jgi:hypothetical protein
MHQSCQWDGLKISIAIASVRVGACHITGMGRLATVLAVPRGQRMPDLSKVDFPYTVPQYSASGPVTRGSIVTPGWLFMSFLHISPQLPAGCFVSSSSSLSLSGW